MRTISMLSIALSLATVACGRDEYTRSFNKTVPVQSGQRISLENKFGDVNIRTHAQSDVTIQAEIRVSASDSNQAKQYADMVEILVEPASELTIRTRYPETAKSFFGMRNISFSVRYDVTIPENSPLGVRNAFGAVSVNGLQANGDILTSHGALIFRNGRGTQRLENSFATVEIANNIGNVSVETSNGGVTASDIKGSLSLRDRFASVMVARTSNGVTIANSNGSVDVAECGGTGDIRNSFGNVTVRGLRGDLTVNNANGRVEGTDVTGLAILKTSFGEVRFSNIGRQLTVRANNSKVTGNKVGGALTIVNSFGAIDVTDAAGDVRIESGNGDVSLGHIGGSVNVKTSFGTVQATNINGELSVDNSNGGVKASDMKGVRVNTSFGPVLVDGVSGPIRIQNQNGAVEASSNLRGSCEPIDIHTSFSTLRVRLETDASYRISARTSFGKIRSDFPLNISGAISSDALNGVLGVGRCEMQLANNNGAIEILKTGQ